MTDLISRAAALLPCPFCGGEAMMQHQLAGYCGARVSCVECDAETGGYAAKGDNDAADARAVTAWNTRALPAVATSLPDPRDAVISGLVKALEAAEELYQAGILSASPDLIAAVPRLRAAALAAAKGGAA